VNLAGSRCPKRNLEAQAAEGSALLPCPSVFRYFPPAVAKVYIVSFRSHDDRRPSKFIVLADNMKSAIKMGLEHGEKRKAKLPVQAINGQCLKCGYRLAWVLVRGKASTQLSPRRFRSSLVLPVVN
jgi:hypothetical protein